MKVFGVLLIIIGVVFGLYSVAMDVTVYVDETTRVANIHLISQQQTYVTTSGIILFIGVIMALMPRKTKELPEEIKNERGVERTFRNDTYFVFVPNYQELDFIKAKESLFNQYSKVGYTYISRNDSTIWTLKSPTKPKSYIQVQVKIERIQIEAYNVEQEPTVFTEAEEPTVKEDTTAQLIELSKMLEKKLITETEFINMKKKLITN